MDLQGPESWVIQLWPRHLNVKISLASCSQRQPYEVLVILQDIQATTPLLGARQASIVKLTGVLRQAGNCWAYYTSAGKAFNPPEACGHSQPLAT
ncbi:hypothetical protein OOU_Y34scaffold00577g6 [Pyricularia oryzae Y34]|uniref:Uncharacterized protein n=2 Tax=Pyricularia oryzae TaxID=318829 RepID=A0AA97PKA2_PYRO3|nr:hypothetical protein OOU_Y34scaffold00577g6 [Pyricularia oryzae Y34]